MNLHIKKPCSENWEAMTPTEQGRFCTSCQKEVIDFTTFSLAEIKLFLEQNPKEDLCGNFYEDQIQAFNARYQVLPNPSRMRQWAAAAILTAVTTLPSFGQESLPLDTTSALQTAVVVSNTPNSSTVVLSGRIWDPVQQKAVPTAILQVKGTTIDGITGIKGNFSITLPLSQEPITLVVNHASYGITYHTLVPNQSRTGLVIELKPILKEEKSSTVLSEKEKKTKKRPRRRRKLRGRYRSMGCPMF